MAGSLTWRPSRVDSRDGSWYVRVPWKDAASVRRWDSASIKASDHGGKRAAKVVAEKRAHELADARRDQAEDPATLAQLTVADLARRWLRATTTDRTADAQRNVAQYSRDYITTTIGHVKLADVSAQHIGQVHQATKVGVSGRPLSDVTRRHVHTTMVAMFGWAVRHRLIDRAPTDQTRPPKVSFTRRQVIPAADQLAVVQAVEAMSPDGPVWMMACAVRLALAAGVRRGELVGLRWGDWDPEVQVLTVARSVLRDRRRPRSWRRRRCAACGPAGQARTPSRRSGANLPSLIAAQRRRAVQIRSSRADRVDAITSSARGGPRTPGPPRSPPATGAPCRWWRAARHRCMTASSPTAPARTAPVGFSATQPPSPQPRVLG
jgi:integrase